MKCSDCEDPLMSTLERGGSAMPLHEEITEDPKRERIRKEKGRNPHFYHFPRLRPEV